MTPLIKNILVFGGLVLLAAAGYYLFVMNKDATISTDQIDLQQQEVQNEVFLNRLNELQQIELSVSILEDERFRSLVDFSTPVNTVPAGRPRPFAAP